MKRVRLTLDEKLLDEVLQRSGERNASAAVMRAMEEFVKILNVRHLFQLAGTVSWEGDLDQMRGRSPASLSRRGQPGDPG
jgi:Arc/MetJ family transcription regulator